MGSNNSCRVNSIVNFFHQIYAVRKKKYLERSVSCSNSMIPNVHVSVKKMEMKIITTEAGAVGLMFGTGHL